MARSHAFKGSAIVAALGVLTLGFSTAHAASTGKTTVSYASGGPQRNGYEHATIKINYKVDTCSGLTVIVGTASDGLQVSENYWFEGTRVKASVPPPRNPRIYFTGTLYSGGQTLSDFNFMDGVGRSNGTGCLSNHTYNLGPLSRYLPGTPTQQQREAFFAAIHVRPNQSPKTLLNEELERSLRAEKARQEKAKQAELAERQRQERAQAAKKEAAASSPAAPTSKPPDPAAQSGPAGLPVSRSAAAPQAPTAEQIRRDLQRQNQRAEAQSRAVERSVMATVNSYYALEALRKGGQNIQSLASLRSDYDSLEELEADYQQQLEAMEEQLRQQEVAEQQYIQGFQSQVFANDPALGQAVGNLTSTLGRMARQDNLHEAQQALEHRRSQMEAQINEKRRLARIEMRKRLLSRFSDGNVPLSSDDIEADKLYFFSYVFDPQQVAQAAPVIILTNTFPVHSKGVGLWPFKFAIKREIGRENHTTLVGFYTEHAVAEEMRRAFARLAQESGFGIREVSYAGPNPPPPSVIPRIDAEAEATSAEIDALSWGEDPTALDEDDYW